MILGLSPQLADQVRRLGQEPAPLPPHVSHRQSASPPAASSAEIGIVISQASPIWRTSDQLTWCRRLRPPPIPTTEEATTCEVEVGAPTSEAPEDHARRRGLAGQPFDRLQAIDALAHGPNDPPPAERRPGVSATAQARVAQVGASLSESIFPAPSSRAAITPTAFWASLAPWLKASAEDMAHWPATTGPVPGAGQAARRGAAAPGSRGAATRPPRTGEMASAIRVPKTPTGLPDSIPPQLTASNAPLDQRGADQPANQGVAGARGQAEPPGRHVPGDRRSQPAADHLGGRRTGRR